MPSRSGTVVLGSARIESNEAALLSEGHVGSGTPTSSQVAIWDVPNDARDELASRAARSGRSLQEYLRRQLIDLASRPDPGVLVQHIVERKQRTASSLAAAEIIEHRDAGRR